MEGRVVWRKETLIGLAFERAASWNQRSNL